MIFGCSEWIKFAVVEALRITTQRRKRFSVMLEKKQEKKKVCRQLHVLVFDRLALLHVDTLFALELYHEM